MAVFRVWTGLPSPKFHDHVVTKPVVEKLECPSNFSTAPTAGTSPFGLCAVIVKIEKGELVLVPGATGTVWPFIVTVIVALLVAGAVNPKVAGWKVMLLPAVMVAVPVTPALEPDPTKVAPTDPVITVIVTLPHLTKSCVLAPTERMDAPPQTLMLAGVSPPAAPEVMRMPVLGEASCMVNWHGVVGHWSPLDKMFPYVVPPSEVSLKSFEKTVG